LHSCVHNGRHVFRILFGEERIPRQVNTNITSTKARETYQMRFKSDARYVTRVFGIAVF
jgi:hypothetical protein